MKITNQAPDGDCIIIDLNKGDKDYQITIYREENGKVIILVNDLEEDAEERLVLGQEGSTTKL